MLLSSSRLFFAAAACTIASLIALSIDRVRRFRRRSSSAAIAQPSLLDVGLDPLVLIVQSMKQQQRIVEAGNMDEGLTAAAGSCTSMLHAVLASGVKLKLDMDKTKLSR